MQFNPVTQKAAAGDAETSAVMPRISARPLLKRGFGTSAAREGS